MRHALIALPLLAAACTTPQQEAEVAARRQADLDRQLAGRVAGAPQDCIATTTFNAGGGAVVAGDSILYREGSRVWRSQVADRCPALRTDQIVVTVQYGAQLCRNDQFRLIDRGTTIPSGACFFNAWVPYDQPRSGG